MNPTLPSPTVLILGANGRLGCAAAQAFDAAGWRVLAQVRRDPSPALPRRAALLRRPLDGVDALVAEARGATVVVHAINPVYTRWDAEAMPALRQGLGIAERLGAHFMLPGNVYNFGTSMPTLLRESTAFRPDTRKGEIRVEMEELMQTRASAGGFTASVVRAGDFFGGGRGNWFDRAIVKSLAAGKLVYPGPLDVPHAWAYLPDLARAFVQVASLPSPATFDTWHFEGHAVTGAEFLEATEAAAASLGCAPAGRWRRAGMPWSLIGAVGLVVPTWRELARMSYLWRVPHALDAGRLNALPGRRSATPLTKALGEALTDLGFGGAAGPALGIAEAPHRNLRGSTP